MKDAVFYDIVDTFQDLSKQTSGLSNVVFHRHTDNVLVEVPGNTVLGGHIFAGMIKAGHSMNLRFRDGKIQIGIRVY